MLHALVLVCSLLQTPNLKDCDQSNAVDVLRVPEDFSNPVMCMMHGQAYLADVSLGRNLQKDEAVVVKCTRT